MKINLQLTVAALSLSLGVLAQTGKRVASTNNVSSTSINEKIISIKESPYFDNRGCATKTPSQQWDAAFNAKVEEYKQNLQTGKAQAVSVTIPVIVHVISFTTSGTVPIGTFPNLLQGQINSQIQVLTADFAGTGLNNGNVPAAFASAKSNTGLSFCLAQKNPTGSLLTEPGIDRINANNITAALGSFPSKNPAATNYNTPSAFQNFVDGYIKPNTIWDPTRYMNIWITDEQAAVGLLGYATFPVLTGTTIAGITGNGSATTDGLWCWAKAFGSNTIFPGGTYDPTYNKGRTATHEIGHWVGLRHIWGDGTCLTDYCNDTPPAQTSNYNCTSGCTGGCFTHPYKLGVCSGNTTGEMFMNFMDYTDDPCMYMFTNDQNSRIQTAMQYGNFRSQLGTSAATLCSIAASAPVASLSIPASGCTNSAIVVNNQSSGNPSPTYVWSSNPAGGVTFNPSNTATAPTINFTTPGNYSITVAATNSVGSNSNTKVITINTCTTATICNDTLTNVTATGTLNVSAAGSDTSTPGCSPKAGYVFGSNCYQDQEKAEYFTQSSYSSITSPQIKAVIVLFYKDGTKGTGGNTATPVNLKIYNGTMTGGPTGTATPLATVTASIGGILAVTATNSVNYVGAPGVVYTNPIIRAYKYTLATPIAAPATNGFFASIKVPTVAGDTAVIMDDQNAAAGTNWEYWSDNTWHDLSVAWGGLTSSMAILPVMQCATVTAVNNNSVLEANVNLYPNPSNGLVNIIATLPNVQNLDITISNTLGQLISVTKHTGVTNNVFTLDLNSYGNGVYFVTINNGQEKIVKRVILNK